MTVIRYTQEHEWVRRDGDQVTIGITAHAQNALGDLVFVELPEVGRTLKPGDSLAVVESVKAASDVYSPISGEVVEINEQLSGNPEGVNQSPEDLAWFAKIKLSNPSELDGLMDRAAYEDYLAGL